MFKAILREWISKFGFCGKLLHDLGGEFNSEDLRELLSSLGIRTTTTAAFSPFSNGIVERLKSVLKSMMPKLNADPENQKLDASTIMSEAVFAKNTLLNRHGFSPFQLVFGKHHLPLIGQYAYQTCSQDNRLKKFESLLVKARKQFLTTENSERIKSALKNTSKAVNQETFQPQDIVAYYRNGTKAEKVWKGPTKVLGIDGNIVIERHGQRVVHANNREVRKFLKQNNNENSWAAAAHKSEKPLMRNEENNVDSNLINRNEIPQAEHNDILASRTQDKHVKSGDMSKEKPEITTSNRDKRQNKPEIMARRTVDYMAFKSGGFPSPHLIVIKTESIPLNNFLKNRRLAIDQG